MALSPRRREQPIAIAAAMALFLVPGATRAADASGPRDAPVVDRAADGPRGPRAGPGLGRCVANVTPCARAHAARALLAGAGLGAALGGAALILGLGDRGRNGDPSYLLAPGGVAVALGALLGQLAAISGREGPLVDPVDVPLAAVALAPGGLLVGGAPEPPHLELRFAPLVRARSPAYARLGVTLRVQTARAWRDDPRPQVAAGLLPSAARGDHEVGFALEPELGAALPYPLPGGRAFLGRVTLLLRPSVVLRSVDTVDAASRHTIVDRLSVLPATIGLRWWITPRQHLLLLVGPRFDGVRLARGGVTVAPLGPPILANVYGTVRYAVDVPLPAAGPTRASGRISLGYTQWKGDGQATDVGASIGYFGPFDVRWDVRIGRPSAWAAQIGLAAVLGRGGGALVEVAVAPPSQERP